MRHWISKSVWACVAVSILALGNLANSQSAPATASAPTSQKITLKRSYKPGKYILALMVDQQASLPQPGEFRMAMDMSIQVQPPQPNGEMTILVRYLHVLQSLQVGDSGMKTDSEKPSSADEKKLYDALLGTQITVTLGADGKVKSVTGLDETWDELVKSSPGLSTPATSWRRSLNNVGVGRLLEEMNAPLTDEPVGIGSTWSRKSDVGIPIIGMTKMDVQYRVADIRKRATTGEPYVVITEDAEITKSPVASTGPAMMPTKILEMDFRMNGTAEADVENVLLLNSKMQQHATIVTENPATESETTTGPAVLQVTFGQTFFLNGRVDTGEASTTQTSQPAQATTSPAN